MEELQSIIPAKRGTATFLPAGKIIRIINTSGEQVIGTWAFALPKPEQKKSEAAIEVEEQELPVTQSPEKQRKEKKKKSKRISELSSREEAEETTRRGLRRGEVRTEDGSSRKDTSWAGYVPRVPTLGFGKSKAYEEVVESTEDSAKNSKTWGSYIAAGKGFSSFIPLQASDTVTQFAGYHARDNEKPYMQQLQDFLKTPVGAAGMAAITGSGYGSSLYAGYSAWNSKHANDIQAMEYLSMTHSRASSLHLIPQVNDTLVTNLREPILTLVEDTSPGNHDSLTAAYDPNQFKKLGALSWERHSSCAENLVLALKEVNERAGLKGAKGVGADVSVNTVPAPLNLFMNVTWQKNGDLEFRKPTSKPGDYVRFLAERDVVVVMSACRQDVMGINGKEIEDAHFIVEDAEVPVQAFKRMPPRKKSMPRKSSSSSRTAVSMGIEHLKKDTKPAAPDPARGKDSVDFQHASKVQVPQLTGISSPKVVHRTPVLSASEKLTQPSVIPRPNKKSIPPAVAAATNSEATAPLERKKPRKLVVRG